MNRLHLGRIPFIIAVCGGAILNMVITSLALFYVPINAVYGGVYGEVCVPSISLFPSSVSSQNDTYTATQKPLLSVGGRGVVSIRACVEAVNLPQENMTSYIKMRQFGLPFAKQISIRTSTFPDLIPRFKNADKISTRGSLMFEIPSSNMHPFSYTIASSDTARNCNISDMLVVCEVVDLNLIQGEEHTLLVKRLLGKNDQTVFEGSFNTVEAIAVSGTSLKEIVYDSPSQITITLNKPLARIGTVSLSYDETPLKLTSSIGQDGKEIVIELIDTLPRGKTVRLIVDDLVAVDGAYLDSRYESLFTTSVGPKVTEISVDSYDVPVDSTIQLSFDQPISTAQDLEGLIGIDNIATELRTDGNEAILVPRANLESCTTYTVTVGDTLQNQYGISGANSYAYTFRTRCKRTASIGTSVEGRSIVSYSYGYGIETILFIGATHGNEISSARLLDSLVDYLERYPNSVPQDKTVVIIPRLNPDGVATNSRTNARNVDLNRNFPALNWKASVKMPDGQVLEQGGGAAPLSEPESAAIAEYVRTVRPVFVATYHSRGYIVMANGSGKSYDVASRYADSTGYGDESYTAASEVFTHDTTGAFEDWLHDDLGIPGLLVELETHTYNEFDDHVDAILEIIKD